MNFVKLDTEKSKMILHSQISTEQYAVGFKKGNEELRDKVEDTLKEMVKDGNFSKISQKWFDMDVCILEP